MESISLHANSENTATKVTNTANVQVKGHSLATAEATVLVKKSADLMVTQTTDKPTAFVGEPLIYDVVVTNNGPSNSTVVILNDTLPETVDFVSIVLSQGTYDRMDHQIVCELGDLDRGKNIEITITVTPKVAGVIHNLAQVSANEYDPNLDNNTSTIANTIKPIRGLRFSYT